jgi:hypothetical protein
MKKLIFILLLFSNNLISQTPYKYDYVESFDSDWSGYWWTPAATANYYTNASVSPSASAVIYGLGNANSIVESDRYSFPNIVVDPAYDYQFRFRLGSYRFSSTNSTRGVDNTDYITVQLSTNGGLTYTNELRITGFSNAYWNYNSTPYTKTANGVLTTIGPIAGGNRTSTGDGYSVIKLNLPIGTSQIAIDVSARVNALGEEWWFDNFEIIKTGGPLPIELISFIGIDYGDYIFLSWVSASEYNNDYYRVEKSLDGINWEDVCKINGMGYSTQSTTYSYKDYDMNQSDLTYYRLSQFDFDGKFKYYSPISVKEKKEDFKQIVGYTDIMGKVIDVNTYYGVYFILYSNGTFEKFFK